jgi:hypothetical protein
MPTELWKEGFMRDKTGLSQLIKIRNVMALHAGIVSKDKKRTEELLLLLIKIEKLDEIIEKIKLHQKVRAILGSLFLNGRNKKAA